MLYVHQLLEELNVGLGSIYIDNLLNQKYIKSVRSQPILPQFFGVIHRASVIGWVIHKSYSSAILMCFFKYFPIRISFAEKVLV